MTHDRLLLPVDGHRRSTGSIQYAIRRKDMGHAVEVCLLHVEQPLGDWALLRNMVSASDASRRRIEHVLSLASHSLADHDIPYAAYLRSGSVVFSILDAAEELDCCEIVVPYPSMGWRRFLSDSVVSTLFSKQRGIPVVPVDERGLPEQSLALA